MFPVWSESLSGSDLYIPNAGYPQGKQGKWREKIPVRENTGNLKMLPKHRENTGNLVCSSCNFPDPKGNRYFAICHENFHFFEDLDKAVLCM